jgi:hypothetical protein
MRSKNTLAMLAEHRNVAILALTPISEEESRPHAAHGKRALNLYMKATTATNQNGRKKANTQRRIKTMTKTKGKTQILVKRETPASKKLAFFWHSLSF